MNQKWTRWVWSLSGWQFPGRRFQSQMAAGKHFGSWFWPWCRKKNMENLSGLVNCNIYYILKITEVFWRKKTWQTQFSTLGWFQTWGGVRVSSHLRVLAQMEVCTGIGRICPEQAVSLLNILRFERFEVWDDFLSSEECEFLKKQAKKLFRLWGGSFGKSSNDWPVDTHVQ